MVWVGSIEFRGFYQTMSWWSAAYSRHIKAVEDCKPLAFTTKLTILGSKKTQQDNSNQQDDSFFLRKINLHFSLHATGQQGLHNCFGGWLAFMPATQISKTHTGRVMCQEISGASFSLGNKSFSNKRIAVPPVDAAAAFVLVKPNPP